VTDRELLELAAKAAQLQIGLWFDTARGGGFQVDAHVWNPLNDDADALRLAVRTGLARGTPIRIRLEFQCDGEQDYTTIEGPHGETTQHHNDDATQSTRRAIVRAAAEIGKQMP
jgi:hypothetical protein